MNTIGYIGIKMPEAGVYSYDRHVTTNNYYALLMISNLCVHYQLIVVNINSFKRARSTSLSGLHILKVKKV